MQWNNEESSTATGITIPATVLIDGVTYKSMPIKRGVNKKAKFKKF